VNALLVPWTPDQVAWVQALVGVHDLVFLGKTLYSHSISLHSGVKMGAGEGTAEGSPVMD